MITKRTFKNQVTLPKEVLKGFPNVDYFDVSAREGEIVLRPVSVTPSAERLSKVREKIKSLGLTQNDLDTAIHWARKSA
jgi:hypothetical protein